MTFIAKPGALIRYTGDMPPAVIFYEPKSPSQSLTRRMASARNPMSRVRRMMRRAGR